MKKSPRNPALTKRGIKKVEKNVEGLGKKVGGLKKKVGGLEREVKITKVEVRKLGAKLDGVRNKVWFDMENLKTEMKDEMALLRNDITGMKDKVVTEVKAMREKFTVHQGAHDRQQEALDNHGKRITSLEKSKFA